MTQDRLNNIMFMYEHKNETESLCLDEIADEFVVRNERRRATFGIKKAL